MRGIALSFLLPLWLIAQTSKIDYSLSGSVLNSQTGEPVKNALVSLSKIAELNLRGGDVSAGAMPNKTSMTGAAGEFQFYGLGTGQYLLNARKPGFSRDDATLASGRIKLESSLTNVAIKLAPLGVIEGTVVDQYGDPVRGVNIVAYSAAVEDGVRTITADRTVATDDRGKYRLSSLSPGKYFLRTAGRTGGSVSYVGDNSPFFSSWESFTPVYLGGAPNLKSAKPIVIAQGTRAVANFSLVLEPAFKIQGTLSNFSSKEQVAFELLTGDEDVSASRATVNSTTGRFEVLDVLPGTYVLRATQEQTMRGETTVSIGGTDLKNVALSLAPAITITGTLHILGPASPGPPVRIGRGNIGADAGQNAACQVSLHDGHAQAAVQGMTAHGDFSIPSVLSGNYTIRFQCFGGYPVSILSGTDDLLANPRLTIRQGEPVAPLEVRLKPGGGTLRGKFDLKEMPENVSVLLVPTFPGSTGPQLEPVYARNNTFTGLTSVVSDGAASATPQQSPEFLFQNLAPGDYQVYAFSKSDNVEFLNPEFLASLPGGIRVRIEDPGEAQVAITSVIE